MLAQSSLLPNTHALTLTCLFFTYCISVIYQLYCCVKEQMSQVALFSACEFFDLLSFHALNFNCFCKLFLNSVWIQLELNKKWNSYSLATWRFYWSLGILNKIILEVTEKVRRNISETYKRCYISRVINWYLRSRRSKLLQFCSNFAAIFHAFAPESVLLGNTVVMMTRRITHVVSRSSPIDTLTLLWRWNRKRQNSTYRHQQRR